MNGSGTVLIRSIKEFAVFYYKQVLAYMVFIQLYFILFVVPDFRFGVGKDTGK